MQLGINKDIPLNLISPNFHGKLKERSDQELVKSEQNTRKLYAVPSMGLNYRFYNIHVSHRVSVIFETKHKTLK